MGGGGGGGGFAVNAVFVMLSLNTAEQDTYEHLYGAECDGLYYITVKYKNYMVRGKFALISERCYVYFWKKPAECRKLLLRN